MVGMKYNEARFDRQLRLWGASGQQYLSQSKVCLVGANAAGTEALKNLVLPGIQSFHVIDTCEVEQADLDANFFLSRESLGNSRAAEVSRYLCKLNPEVMGSADCLSVIELLKGDPNYFRQFTLVLFTANTDKASFDAIKTCISGVNIPIVMLFSSGLMGVVRLFYQQICVMQTSESIAGTQLRLDAPWPKLIAHFESYDLESMEAEIRDVPYLVLLYHYRKEWLMTNKLTTAREKKQFKDFLKEKHQHALKKMADAHIEDTDYKGDCPNFEELFTKAYLAWSTTTTVDALQKLSKQTQSLFTHKGNDDLKEADFELKSNEIHISKVHEIKFWALVHAMIEFSQANLDRKSMLPVDGNLPDMHSKTEFYIALQRIYNEQARLDAEEVFDRARALLISNDCDPELVTLEDSIVACRNASQFYARSGSCFKTLEHVIDCSPEITEHELENLLFYLFFVLAFEKEENPGEILTRKMVFQSIGNRPNLKRALSAYDDLFNKTLTEFTHFFKTEAHCTAAVIGGLAAQEAIKLLTKRFVPCSDCIFFNGITGSISPTMI